MLERVTTRAGAKIFRDLEESIGKHEVTATVKKNGPYNLMTGE